MVGEQGCTTWYMKGATKASKAHEKAFFPAGRTTMYLLERLSELQFINAILLCSADCIHMTGHAKSC